VADRNDNESDLVKLLRARLMSNIPRWNVEDVNAVAGVALFEGNHWRGQVGETADDSKGKNPLQNATINE